MQSNLWQAFQIDEAIFDVYDMHEVNLKCYKNNELFTLSLYQDYDVFCYNMQEKGTAAKQER